LKSLRSELEKPINIKARVANHSMARRQAGRSAQRREQEDEVKESRQRAYADIGFA